LSVVLGKRYRSNTSPISPLALRENQFFHTFPLVKGGWEDLEVYFLSNFGKRGHLTNGEVVIIFGVETGRKE
jgi:hypothetical protein